MCTEACLRFVTDKEAIIELLPWGPHEWLARPGLVNAERLQLVRVQMPPGCAHRFHRHPCFEELLYVIDGQVEQWVGREHRILKAGELAHVPKNEVHGSYNRFDKPVTFLAILSENKFDGPAVIDMHDDEPWKSLRP
jgi:quercetin dioxygenase-like cupin family protein